MEPCTDRVVIVGAGHAAAELVSALRKQNWLGEIILIGEEARLPYQRPPLSKGYLQGALRPERLLIKPLSLYQTANVDLRLSCKALSIDRETKQVLLEQGDTVNYDKLVLATGARARQLPIVGNDLPQVYTLRSQSDTDRIQQSLIPGAHVLLVGADYIGLEVAASLRQNGIRVTVVEAEQRVLKRVTCPQVSHFYYELHKQHGVDIRLNTKLDRLEPKDHGVSAVVSGEDASRESLEVDCVVVGVGVLPNIALAERADLSCEDGVVVDEYCRTDDQSIYAVGDCCAYPNALYGRRVRIESVPNAVEQAQIVAIHLSNAAFVPPQVPWFWSDQYEVKLQTVGLLTGYDQTVVRGDVDCGKFVVFYLQQGRLIAVDAINSVGDFMAAKKILKAVLTQPNYKLSLAKLVDVNVPLKSLIGL